MKNPRKSPRLYGYDYTQRGAYFVTICTNNKKQIFWNNYISNPIDYPQIQLSNLGKIADETVQTITEKYNVSIDKYVIMPNHIHMIVFMPGVGTTARVAPTWSLSQIIGAYKSIVASKWLKICKVNNIIMGDLWQRSYYEHVIRDDNEYQSIWQYIDTNPIKWTDDEYYPIP